MSRGRVGLLECWIESSNEEEDENEDEEDTDKAGY
jgi:hypothetical protein